MTVAARGELGQRRVFDVERGIVVLVGLARHAVAAEQTQRLGAFRRALQPGSGQRRSDSSGLAAQRGSFPLLGRRIDQEEKVITFAVSDVNSGEKH